MRSNQQEVPAGGAMTLLFVLISAIALKEGLVAHTKWYQLLIITIPVLLLIRRKFR